MSEQYDPTQKARQVSFFLKCEREQDVVVPSIFSPWEVNDVCVLCVWGAGAKGWGGRGGGADGPAGPLSVDGILDPSKQFAPENKTGERETKREKIWTKKGHFSL